MIRRVSRGVVLALVFILALAACGGNNQEEPGASDANAAGEKPSSLIIATGGTAGTYYPLGGGIANLIQEKAGTNATAQVTGAAVENMRLISDKEVDLAITQGDIADYAAKGTEMFNDGAVGNLQAIGALYQETIQIVVSEKSGITTVSELKGKKVSVGAPGSGTEVNARQILEAYGLTFDDLSTERLSFGDSAKKMQDGGLDAAFVTAGAPTAAINELAATTGIKLLTIEDDKVKAITDKYKYYSQQIIPAGTYPKQDAEVKTVAVKAIMSVRAELDEQLVYDITKTIYENTEPLIAINAKANEIKTDNALEGISIPLHPGAEKYLKEKGVIK
ncbi:TAXI family TRAP transporter solute-binding subunit [Paenibacillus soyae]|uniref:TAXI family TRAP transporter solute-binding subunit n=1 Tax=Paenibacillus soyae TaxID=2969249 RepID=A0A9X2S9W8_9BACL|nr:TAXI family TRAP transporter solute-binding subunit [Paenibacillus soyae]MCR2805475.1 TAXI family TRAP transporter solute-binding subunit [Paenibacillus soyae]